MYIILFTSLLAINCLLQCCCDDIMIMRFIRITGYWLLIDSKTLTEALREKHFHTIDCSSYIGWIVEILSPNYISNLMLRRFVKCQTSSSFCLPFFIRTKYNLNSISHDSAIGLIEKLTANGVNIVEVW